MNHKSLKMCMIAYRRSDYDNPSIYLVFCALFEISNLRVTCIFALKFTLIYIIRKIRLQKILKNIFFMIYHFLCHLVYNGMNIYGYTFMYSIYIYIYKFWTKSTLTSLSCHVWGKKWESIPEKVSISTQS